MLYPCLHQVLVTNGPAPNLFWGSLPTDEEAVELDDRGLVLGVTPTAGGGQETYIGSSPINLPGTEHARDGGVLYYRTQLLFTARAAVEHPLAAVRLIDHVRERMTMLRVGQQLIELDPMSPFFPMLEDNTVKLQKRMNDQLGPIGEDEDGDPIYTPLNQLQETFYGCEVIEPDSFDIDERQRFFSTVLVELCHRETRGTVSSS